MGSFRFKPDCSTSYHKCLVSLLRVKLDIELHFEQADGTKSLDLPFDLGTVPRAICSIHRALKVGAVFQTKHVADLMGHCSDCPLEPSELLLFRRF